MRGPLLRGIGWYSWFVRVGAIWFPAMSDFSTYFSRDARVHTAEPSVVAGMYFAPCPSPRSPLSPRALAASTRSPRECEKQRSAR
jgi:hypothetical protein